MPVFFICFIVFIIWIQVKTKQNNKNVSTWDEEFWEKEKEANFVRKKDIEHLDYLVVKEGELPFSDSATGEEKERQEQVQKFLDKKMLNLSGMSNTDIKLAYGTANFPVLSEYDQNFNLFIRNLGLWGSYLHKNCPGNDDRAKQILTYAVSLGSDITDTYLTLADIYLEENNIENIEQLIQQVNASDFFMKESIARQLREKIRTYD